MVLNLDAKFLGQRFNGDKGGKMSVTKFARLLHPSFSKTSDEFGHGKADQFCVPYSQHCRRT
jgi:hypothetical protein